MRKAVVHKSHYMNGGWFVLCGFTYTGDAAGTKTKSSRQWKNVTCKRCHIRWRWILRWEKAHKS